MDRKNVIESYKNNFIEGKTYNYYLDTLRFSKQDTWITTDEWVEMAQVCIDRQNNVLQALEILIREKFEQYYPLADKVLSKWYADGGHDVEYYFDILVAMPKEYPIRKEIMGDYSDFLLDYSSISNASTRKSLVNANDFEFCEIYGTYLDKEVQRCKDNHDELELLIEENYIFDLSKKMYRYIKIDTLNTIKGFLQDYLQKDKEMAYRLMDGYKPISEERRLWIADRIALIAYSIDWTDLIDYLKSQEWYWLLMFDKEYGYEDNENINLLVWSQMYYNKHIENRSKELLAQNRLDGEIALSRGIVQASLKK